MDTLLTAEPPIHSTAALARKLDCARDSLNKCWKRATRGRTPLTFGDVVDIIILLSVVEREAAHIGWRYSLDKHFHMRPERIERISQDVFSMSRGEACAERFLEMMASVERNLLMPLQGRARNAVRRRRRRRAAVRDEELDE